MIAQATFILACSPAVVLLAVWGVDCARFEREQTKKTGKVNHETYRLTCNNDR